MFKFFSLMLAGIFALSPAQPDAAPDITDQQQPEIGEQADIEPEESMMTGGMMIVNPMQRKKSADEINEAVGCRITVPEDFSTEEESFFVYSITPLLGQYRFTSEGAEYTLRTSETADDISGVYHGGKTLGSQADESGTDTLILENAVWMRRFMGNMQYSLYAEGENLAADAVSALFESLVSSAE